MCRSLLGRPGDREQAKLQRVSIQRHWSTIFLLDILKMAGNEEPPGEDTPVDGCGIVVYDSGAIRDNNIPARIAKLWVHTAPLYGIFLPLFSLVVGYIVS